MSVALDFILYSDRMVGKDSPDYDDTLNAALNQVLVASDFASYETAFTGFAKRAASDGSVGKFMIATGATTTDWKTPTASDISDLATAATGITKLGTVNTGVWAATSISTTYTDAKIKTVTGTSNRLSVSGTATDPIFNIDPTYIGQTSITTVGTIATGTWQGSVIATAYTTAQVIDIAGVSNRTTVGGTATHPTVDISSAYVGQNTITTLGTVATGTWNATAIANAYIASGLDVAKLTVGTTLPSNIVASSLTQVGTIATGAWQGTSISTTYTDAKLTAVAGTANRLTASAATGSVTFDISAAYVGQSSITTVGTVTSGTWSATAIAPTVGGTGLTTYALGDTLYSSASNTLAKLAGNTGTQMKFLAQTGDGVNSAAPGWHTFVTADITDLTSASTGITKVGTIATGVWNGTVIGAMYGGTGVNNGSSTVTLGGNILTAGSFTTAGAFAMTLTATGATSVTLPTSGTLVNTAGTGASGTWAISISGVAATATALATARAINGVNFDGTAPITVTAAAGTLTGATLASNVLASSLTSVGVLASPHVTTLSIDSGGITVTAGTIIAAASLTGAASANIPHGATPSSPNNGDLWTTTSGVFWRVAGATKQVAFIDVATLSSLTSIGTIGTGVWQGTSIATTYTDAKIKTVTGTANRLTIGGSSTDPTFDISTSYVGQATITTLGTIATGVWNGTAITDTYLATISTAGKVSNSATTATSANTASAIVARDVGGSFSAGTITATFTGNLTGAVTGNASTATALAVGHTLAITGDLTWTSPSFDGSGNVTAAGTLATVNANVGSFGGSTAIPVFTVNAKGLITAASTAAVVAPAGTLSGATLAAGVTASSLTSLGTLTALTVTGTSGLRTTVTRDHTPEADNAYTLGDATHRWGDFRSVVATIGQVTATSTGGDAGYIHDIAANNVQMGLKMIRSGTAFDTTAYVCVPASSTSVQVYNGDFWIEIKTTGVIAMKHYGAGTATFDASGNISSVSDERLKNILEDVNTGLSAIRLIQPIRYTWREESGMETQNSYVGFGAQNVRNAFADATGVNPDGYFSLQDRAILALLVNAVKELDARLN